ncbi:uncharacterized protein MONBRDRAFT_8990 [Monosiga brevicollis MX1]|uniref:SH2 domain-containing protein n=1 Tax=Monosiga brevicollis TaxID=81824 RepID=A9V1R5_MONBE|nr:uncharacterized protein MONBRDRAFT_8990 [Monosiga brevicollis MX1]EDQ88607.1 predicted protein [Monosiga brevicollis MX1]|eukprot:XP_001746711.1 hypothetical protein [Monosiga brevicollis MX1]
MYRGTLAGRYMAYPLRACFTASPSPQTFPVMSNIGNITVPENPAGFEQQHLVGALVTFSNPQLIPRTVREWRAELALQVDPQNNRISLVQPASRPTTAPAALPSNTTDPEATELPDGETKASPSLAIATWDAHHLLGFHWDQESLNAVLAIWTSVNNFDIHNLRFVSANDADAFGNLVAACIQNKSSTSSGSPTRSPRRWSAVFHSLFRLAAGSPRPTTDSASSSAAEEDDLDYDGESSSNEAIYDVRTLAAFNEEGPGICRARALSLSRSWNTDSFSGTLPSGPGINRHKGYGKRQNVPKRAGKPANARAAAEDRRNSAPPGLWRDGTLNALDSLSSRQDSGCYGFHDENDDLLTIDDVEEPLPILDADGEPDWLFRELDWESSEFLLDGEEPGTFLIRAQDDALTLSLKRVDARIEHVPIMQSSATGLYYLTGLKRVSRSSVAHLVSYLVADHVRVCGSILQRPLHVSVL